MTHSLHTQLLAFSRNLACVCLIAAISLIHLTAGLWADTPIEIVEKEVNGVFGHSYTAKRGTNTIVEGIIKIGLHKRSRKKFFTYSVELEIKDFPYLEEPTISIDFDVYHFGDDSLREELKRNMFDKLKLSVKEFTEETARMLLRHRGFFEACSAENTDCLKNKIDEKVNSILSSRRRDSTSDIRLSKGQKIRLVRQINYLIDDQEELIDDEYEKNANMFAERALGIISEYYNGTASDKLEESGFSSNVLRRKASRAILIVGKAVFNILWKGIKIIGIDIPTKVKTAFKIVKEVVVAANELIKLANVWGDLAEKEDTFLTYYLALKGFEVSPTSSTTIQRRRTASGLESLINDTENAYEDYEKTIKLVCQKGLDKKIDATEQRVSSIIESSGEGMDLGIVRNTAEYQTIMKIINREEYVTLQQFKSNLEAADDSIGNFAKTYKREYLNVINKKTVLLGTLTRAEDRELGRSSRGEKVKDWLKRKRKMILSIWEKLEQGAGILETIQGDAEEDDN